MIINQEHIAIFIGGIMVVFCIVAILYTIQNIIERS